MKRRKYLYIIISIVFLIIGAIFCFKSISMTKVIDYGERSNVNYTVCLKRNTYYINTCLEEEREYLSALTDLIRINFNYTKLTKNGNNVTYYIGSKLKIYNKDNGKEVYSIDKKLSDNKELDSVKNVINIVEDIDIKYDEYNDIVKSYREDYQLYTNSVLDVYLMVIDGKKEKKVATLNIPIDQQTYSIEKEIITEEKEPKIDESFKDYLLLGMLSISISIVVVGLTIYKSIEESKKGNFELEVNKILVEYDRVIVETKLDKLDINGKELIEINDFLELIDVRDTIEKPIMYIKKNDYVRDFIVQDGNILYRYRMTDKNNNSIVNIKQVMDNTNNYKDNKPRDGDTGKTLELPKIDKDFLDNNEEFSSSFDQGREDN